MIKSSQVLLEVQHSRYNSQLKKRYSHSLAVPFRFYTTRLYYSRLPVIEFGGMAPLLFLVFSALQLWSVWSITKVLPWDLSVGNQGTTTISTGDTITWRWNDEFPHSIRSSNGAFTSSTVLFGFNSTYSVTFPTVGSFPYQCDVHGTLMRGVIAVLAGPTSNPTKMPSLPPSTVGGPTPPLTKTPTTSPTKVPIATPTAPPTPLDMGSILANKLTYPQIISSGKSIASKWSATIRVREHRHSNTQVSFTTRSYCYNEICSYPGPTIHLLPGDNFTLTFINELGPQPKDYHVMNKMNGPNTTNVHTHGLHIDPHVDTVFVKAEPGGTLVYKYQMPSDHAPGLMWYHDHHHGSSTLHLMNGLVGAIEVLPNPSGVQKIPASITNGDNHVLVVTKLVTAPEMIDGVISQGCDVGFPCDSVTQSPLCTGTETSSPFNMFRVYSLQELETECGGEFNSNIQLTDPSITDMDFVNGLYRPTLELRQNSPSYLRTLNAFGGVPLELSISDPSVCEMNVIAYDGVYQTARWFRTMVNIPAASRAVIEVFCKETGVYYLNNGNKPMMTLYVTATSGSIKSKVTDTELASIVRPFYLSDLTGSSTVVNHQYSLSLAQEGKSRNTCGFWMGTGKDCGKVVPHGLITPSALSADCPFSQYKGQRGLDPSGYIPDGKLVTYVGAVNEWRIYGVGSAKHPLSGTSFLPSFSCPITHHPPPSQTYPC
jgi:FtsP/CotA-like multicopper oxidase with cupredoxin domain